MNLIIIIVITTILLIVGGVGGLILLDKFTQTPLSTNIDMSGPKPFILPSNQIPAVFPGYNQLNNGASTEGCTWPDQYDTWSECTYYDNNNMNQTYFDTFKIPFSLGENGVMIKWHKKNCICTGKGSLCTCPTGDGISCDGRFVYEYQPCQKDAQWTPWSMWSQCKNNQQNRYRKCVSSGTDGKAILSNTCQGESVQIQRCQQQNQRLPGLLSLF